MLTLGVQISYETMSRSGWVKEVLLNCGGLKTHGYKTNKLLKQWLIEEGHKLRHINFFSLDYMRPKVCELIYKLNEVESLGP